MNDCCGNEEQSRSEHHDAHPHGSAVLKIEGMTCGHCQMRVEQALNNVQGVTNARVDLDKKEAVVTGNVDKSKLVQAVEEVGYSVVN